MYVVVRKVIDSGRDVLQFLVQTLVKVRCVQDGELTRRQ